MLLYEICAGRPPFSDADQVSMFDKICNVKYKFPSGFSPVRPSACSQQPSCACVQPAAFLAIRLHGSARGQSGVMPPKLHLASLTRLQGCSSGSAVVKAAVPAEPDHRHSPLPHCMGCRPLHGVHVQELQDLISRLLRKNPAHRLGVQRAGAADVKRHPWFAAFDWAAFSKRTLPPPYLPQVLSAPTGIPQTCMQPVYVLSRSLNLSNWEV